MHKVLVNHLGGLSLPRKSVVRLTDHPDMTLDVYRGGKTTTTTIFLDLDCLGLFWDGEKTSYSSSITGVILGRNI